jgi:hypothetical protein
MFEEMDIFDRHDPDVMELRTTLDRQREDEDEHYGSYWTADAVEAARMDDIARRG